NENKNIIFSDVSGSRDHNKTPQIAESPKKDVVESKQDSTFSHNISGELGNQEKIALPELEKKIEPSKPSHPIVEQYGEDAYRIHSYFEKLFQLTFYDASVAQDSNLRLVP